MRSSSAVHLIAKRVGWVVAGGCLVLPGCSTPSAPPAAKPAASTSNAVECVVADGSASRPDDAAVAELRRSVEAGPLYVLLAATAPLASCRISGESTVLTLDYQFRDGGSLRAERDSSIEFSSQDVRFGSPWSEDPVAALTRAERAAFAPDGCGIDWRKAAQQSASDDANGTEDVYRGDVCNCQARVRRDAAGRVTGLVLRSAC